MDMKKYRKEYYQKHKERIKEYNRLKYIEKKEELNRLKEKEEYLESYFILDFNKIFIN